ncbi:MAG: prolyl oligopeptidase family serine peptidase [bacterium]|nr:prolyl oligopeptidase family serine peptidase [bacterium]
MESYVSEIDGSVQPFGLYIPEPFDPNVPHPVVFHAQGYGGAASTGFSGTLFANEQGWILVNLDGDGESWYEGIGEHDFFRVLNELRRQYLIDENRLYLTGCSTGGLAALRLGFRHPDLFAAVAGSDAFWDYRWFHRMVYGKSSNPEWIEPTREPLLQSGSPLSIAENVKHLNVYMSVDVGDGLVPLANGRNLDARLDELGYAHSYNEYPGGHCQGFNLGTIYEFFSQRVNEPSPKDVVLKANQLQYGSAYWVRIDRLEKTGQFGMIVAKITGRQKDIVEVTTNGLIQFTLFLTPELAEVDEVSVLTNGELTYTGPPQEITVSASLDESGNIVGWSTADTLPRGLRKTAQSEGPIGHAYTSKFLLVRGTTSKTDTARNRLEAEKFATEWNTWMHASIWPVEDASITADDIATSNLILFGTADSNSVIREINDLLPVRIWKDRIVAGAQEYEGSNYGLYMVFPNPLNPQRYVVISHGTIEGSHETDLEALPWYWPDYVVFDTNTVPEAVVSSWHPPLVYLPDAWVEAGFFDQYWRLDEDEDELDDIFEKQIIDADTDDGIAAIMDVNPGGDFDGDGQDNRTEYNAGTSPTDAVSFFCVLSVAPDPGDSANFNVSWKTAPGRSYYIQWADSADGPWHEIGELDPGDIEDNGDIRTWTDKGTDPAMGGTKPGNCPARFYKLAACR